MNVGDPWSERSERGDANFGLGLVTLVIGAAIGAVTALLLAPKSGKDLRSQVVEQAGDWKSHAAEALAQGRERVVSAVESDHPASSPQDEKISPSL